MDGSRWPEAAPAPRPGLGARLNRLLADPRSQSLLSRIPFLRSHVRREGEALMDLVSGFVQSQALLAIVELDLLPRLMDGPRDAAALATGTGLAPERMVLLLNAGAAMGLVRRLRSGLYALTPRGAALTGVPGLTDMIRHHKVLYGDLADPLAVLRGEAETELARFWPYVFGAADGSVSEETAHRYSRLMSDSQGLVAEETLRAVSFRRSRHLMDVGGGTGAFLSAALAATPGLRGTLVDLPPVVPEARARFAAAGLADRATVVPASFRDGPLPGGADAISLVRVLYDHADATVAELLARAHAALPPGGRLVVSEPMTGGDNPTRAGDVYFAFYCLAMRTGRARSTDEIAALLSRAGFTEITVPRVGRRFLTSVITAVKSD